MTRSRAVQAQLGQAERTLLALLRTPKTKAGLVAAIKSKTISRNYVYGFLSEGKRTGRLVTLKSGALVMYQVAGTHLTEKSAVSEYPSWLDPRSLPVSAARAVFIDGVAVKKHEKEATK